MDPRIELILKQSSRDHRMTSNGITPSFTLTTQLAADLAVHVIAREGLHVAAVVGARAWAHMIGDVQWQNVLDPSAKVEEVTSGRLGSALGIELLTIAFEEPGKQAVLLDSDEAVFASLASTVQGVSVVRSIRIKVR